MVFDRMMSRLHIDALLKFDIISHAPDHPCGEDNNNSKVLNKRATRGLEKRNQVQA